MGLSRRQRAFVEYYLQIWNATEAAKRAGYSERTARQQGSRLLSNVDIQARIAERLDELKMSADEVLIRLGQQARGDYARYIEISIFGHPMLDLEAMAADGNLHLVKRWKYDGEGRLEVEFYDAQSALVQLGRHHQLFTDNVSADVRLTDIDDEFRSDMQDLLGQLSRLTADGAAPGVSGAPDAGPDAEAEA